MPIRNRLALITVLLCLLGFGTVAARAEIEQKGNLRVAVSGKLSPRALPRQGSAPVAVTVGGKISTVDGTEPPQLRKIEIEINRHGRLDPTGLSTCQVSQIRTASSGRALAACGPSLVGGGEFLGTLSLPGAAPYPLKGKLLLFNGLEGKRHVLLGHVFSPHPFANSFVITFDVRSAGKKGTILVANLKKALGTQRNLTGIEITLDRRFSYRGKHRSYVSAGCPAPKGVNLVSFPLARASFAFADGTKIDSTLTRECRPRG